jgi:hypothetical protein
MKSIKAMKLKLRLGRSHLGILVIQGFFPNTTGIAGTVDHVGSYSNWATTWQPLSNGTDAASAVDSTLDFVGDLTNPGLYWSSSDEYIFFRMRVNAETFTTNSASGAHILLIDVVGAGNTGIDYGFSWDSKSNDNTKHGLEMSIPATNGPTWGASQMDDLDGLGGSKGTNDINGDSRTTDGYVRSIDGQVTTNFANTTFIDYAVKWSYLEAHTTLRKNQTWNIAAASIANATDHNAFNADVSGAELEDSISVGWSSANVVPETSTTLMIGLTCLMGAVLRRRPVRPRSNMPN